MTITGEIAAAIGSPRSGVDAVLATGDRWTPATQGRERSRLSRAPHPITWAVCRITIAP